MKIGLIGFKQVGKSTAAEYLRLTYGFERINFKDGMIAQMLVNFPDFIPALCRLMDRLYWDGKPWTFERLNKEKPEVWRNFMVNFGTDLWRAEDNDKWVNLWSARARQFEHVVADDVRFLNEAHTVKMQRGTLIRLVRPDVTTGGGHSSETQQLDIVADYTIEVGLGEFDKLHAELDKIVAEVMHRQG